MYLLRDVLGHSVVDDVGLLGNEHEIDRSGLALGGSGRRRGQHEVVAERVVLLRHGDVQRLVLICAYVDETHTTSKI
jgi:hypothetical protein